MYLANVKDNIPREAGFKTTVDVQAKRKAGIGPNDSCK